MEALIEQVKAEGDTIGGIITCVIKGCPAGLGEPEFGKLHAALGAAMLSINAVKGFEYGEGFDGVTARGSEQNDVFVTSGDDITTVTNHSGGIQGGITNGEEVCFNVAFKPIPTIGRGGRHDVCALPRAVVIVEAMAALTVISFMA